MQNRHEWFERDEDRKKVEFRGQKFGGKWTISSKAKGEEFWEKHNPPSVELVEKLLDIVWKKYQRKRVSYDDVEYLRKWIETLKAAEGNESSSLEDTYEDDESL